MKLRLPLANLAAFAALVAVTAVPLITQESSSDSTELERLQASGAPVTFADLTRVPGEDVINAESILNPVRVQWVAIDSAVASKHAFGAERQSDEFLSAWDSVAEQRKQVFAAVDEAAEADVWLPSVNGNAPTAQVFIDELQEDSAYIRSLARVLMYRSSVQIGAGQHDEAARTALSLLKLARLYPGFGMMNFLNHSAMQQVGLSTLGLVLKTSAGLKMTTHEAIDAELARHDSLTALTNCLIYERVIGLQLLRDQGAVGILRVEPYLKAMRIAIAESGKTIGEQAELLDPKTHGVTGAMLDSGAKRVRGTAHRGLANVRVLRVINRLRSSMLDSMELASVDLPEASRMDPFTDRPLVMRRTDQGMLVYSLGRNRLDDGGDFIRRQDVGIQISLEDE